MTITISEIHTLMKDFHQQHQRLPNTILLPAAQEFLDGMSPSKLERIFCVKVVYAAVPLSRAAIL